MESEGVAAVRMSYLGGATSSGEAPALEQQKLPAPEQAVIKSANECQICGQKFMVGQSFSVRGRFCAHGYPGRRHIANESDA